MLCVNMEDLNCDVFNPSECIDGDSIFFFCLFFSDLCVIECMC